MTERRTSAEMARRLEQAGFELEVAPTGKRWWREPGTGRMLSGDHGQAGSGPTSKARRTGASQIRAVPTCKRPPTM